MNKQFRREQAIQTLNAIVMAMEGEVPMGYHGFIKAYSNDGYNVMMLLEDGNEIPPEQANLQELESAIYQWRDEHMQFFQKILCAMM
ncbi:MAG: hypothetical protein K6F47_05220 [Bacteroidaceae bacterium]|jgi:hypothetical protein|nr:hypothetical protein [Bacteroidaceae bacterium]